MFCPQCATQVETGDKFCRSCASPLSVPVSYQATRPVPLRQTDQATISKAAAGKNLQIVGWFMCLSFIAISFMTLMGRSEKSGGGYAEIFIPLIFLMLSAVGFVVALIGRFKQWFHASNELSENDRGQVTRKKFRLNFIQNLLSLA